MLHEKDNKYDGAVDNSIFHVVYNGFQHSAITIPAMNFRNGC